MTAPRYPILHIVIPVYNEAASMPQVFAEIEAKLHMPYRILVVYDTDEDNTLPVVRERMLKDANVALVKNRYGKGALNAIRSGFAVVEEGAVLVMMADLADDLNSVDEMFARMNEGYDLVCGSRYMPGGRQIGGPLLKSFLSRLAGLSLRLLTGLPTHDATNSFKIYSKELLNNISIESRGGFELGIEIVVKAYAHGYRITEVPSVWTDRVAGESRFRLWGWLPHYLHWYWYGLRNCFWRKCRLRTNG